MMEIDGPAKKERRDRRSSSKIEIPLDTELEHLPAEFRWREWMMRVEAIIFAASEPVRRETLARVVGEGCDIDRLIADLRAEMKPRPYDIVSVAGGWQYRTKPAYAHAIRASKTPTRALAPAISHHEAMVLIAIGYFQPITRGELSKIFGKEISRDTIASIRGAGLLDTGPRSPMPGAPYTYVTTKYFLSAFGFETLRDLPDIEALEDAGLLNRTAVVVTDSAIENMQQADEK
jgi:chromosome segregation and condensation protein ScpB